MIIRLFGITTPTGSFLLNILENRFDKIYCYSRKKKFEYLDMNNVNFQKDNLNEVTTTQPKE